MSQQILHSEEDAILSTIQLISKKSKYQIYLIGFLAINFHVMAFSLFSLPIFFENPTFKCQGSAAVLSEEKACPIISECTISNSLTLTSRLSLFCNQEADKRNLIQSLNGFGAVFGVLMVNWLADRKGKKFCIIISIFLALLHSLFFLFGSLYFSIQLLALSQFLIGYSLSSYMTLIYLLGSKYLDGQMRHYVVLLFNMFGPGFGQISMAIIHTYFPSWQFYAIINIVFFLLSLIASFFVVKQDPIFLFNNNEMDKLMNLIQEVGTINEAPQSQIIEAQNNLINKYRFKRSPEIFSFIPIHIISFRLILLIAIMASCSFTTNIIQFGIGFGVQSLGFTMTQSLLIFGVSEIVNYVLSAIFMPYLPSISKILCISTVISAVAFFCLSFEIVEHSFLLRVFAIFIARFFLITYACFHVTYYIQNLPKNIEGTSAGIIESVGSTGKILAPLLITMSQKIHLNHMISFSIVMIMGIGPLLFLSKTKEDTHNQEDSTSLQKQ